MMTSTHAASPSEGVILKMVTSLVLFLGLYLHGIVLAVIPVWVSCGGLRDNDDYGERWFDLGRTLQVSFFFVDVFDRSSIGFIVLRSQSCFLFFREVKMTWHARGVSTVKIFFATSLSISFSEFVIKIGVVSLLL
jgi:hypothetical protein